MINSILDRLPYDTAPVTINFLYQETIRKNLLGQFPPTSKL
jgi:hypothetical protein